MSSAACCEQCGNPITQPRRGSQRKRFCSSSCRGKAHRGTPPEPGVALKVRITAQRRLSDLEDIYGMLLAEIRVEGSAAKPVVDRLLRVSNEIGRLAGPTEPVEEDDILRAVG